MNAAAAARARLPRIAAALLPDLLTCIAFGLCALALGQAAGWDLQNYHLYDPWAWLHGRLDRDIAPAQLQTYFNPLLHVPFYLATLVLPAAWITFLLGAVQGLNAVLLRHLAQVLLAPASLPRWLPWLIALAGTTGATAIAELGATQGDNLVSIPLLAALLVAARVPRQERASPAIAALLCGGLLGIACGLKLALLPMCAGLAVGATVLAGGWHPRWLVPAFAGALAGLLLSAGPWAWEMWTRWHDPLFPWLSSPPFGDALTTQSLQDARWHPRGALDALLYPAQWLGDWRRVSELRFRDLRVPLLLALLVLLPWWRRGDLALRRSALALAVATLVGYAGWLALSGYYRYLAPLEMLAPLAIVLFVLSARAPTAPSRVTLAVLLALLIVTTNPPDWGHLRRHGAHYVSADWPRSAYDADSLVLLSGNEPLAFLATVFPVDVAFVRIDGNMYGAPRPPIVLDRQVAQRIDAHRGTLLLLAPAKDASEIAPAAQALGLRLDAARCDPVHSNVRLGWQPPLWLCTVSRAETAAAALARR